MANKASGAAKTRRPRLASEGHRQSQSLLALLAGGDRRSIGRADQVATTVLRSPRLFPRLIQGLWSADSLVRMRAADAVEKISREKPELLRRYKKELLGLMQEAGMKQQRMFGAKAGLRAGARASGARRSKAVKTSQAVSSDATEEKEVRWHLALIAARLPLNASEREVAVAALKNYLEDRSSIVRTFALQALADFAANDEGLRVEVIELLQHAVRAGTAAMKARSRKLLARLNSAIGRDKRKAKS